MRKITSIILTIMFVISTFAFAAVGTGAEEAVETGATVDFGSVAADYKPAEGATPVGTVEEFAAMAADGNYYLTADITLTATYGAKTDTAAEVIFTGTLDGNGHTLTISAPVFSELNGTVKNLKLAGSVTRSSKVGALVIDISNAATVENVANAATVTNTSKSDEITGGLIGKINNNKNNAVVVIKNCYNSAAVTGPEAVGGILGESQATTTAPQIIGCVNDGVITSNVLSKSGVATGGIVGYSGTGPVHIENCVNNGKIDSLYRAGGIMGDARKSAKISNCTNNGEVTGFQQAAGIVGYACGEDTTTPIEIDGCVNNANINALKYTDEAKTTYDMTGDAAGILANVGHKKASGNHVVKNCTNTGDVTGGYRVGGLVGYCYGANDKQFLTLENSINLGDVTAVQYVSNFVAYTNSPNTILKNCVGGGKLTLLPYTPEDPTELHPDGKIGHRVVFGCSKADVSLCTVENVFLCDGGTTDWFTWANDEANAGKRIAFSYVDGKDLANYKYPTYPEGVETMVDFTFAEGTTSNVKAITQTETVNDEFVNAVNTAFGKTVLYNNNGSLSLEAPPAPPVVDPEGPDTPTTPATGDMTGFMFALLTICTVASFGLALVPSKKHN